MAQKQQGQKPKHIPQRTCIACRKVANKGDFVRLVRIEGDVEVDPSGKQAGRGAYLHANQKCWQQALESRWIEQALRVKISANNRQHIIEYMKTLPS